MVGAPRAGDACGLLDSDALPALGEVAGEAGVGVPIRLDLSAKPRHILLAQGQELGGHRVEGSDFGIIDGAQADVGEGTGDAHYSTSKVARPALFLRVARLCP